MCSTVSDDDRSVRAVRWSKKRGEGDTRECNSRKVSDIHTSSEERKGEEEEDTDFVGSLGGSRISQHAHAHTHTRLVCKYLCRLLLLRRSRARAP